MSGIPPLPPLRIQEADGSPNVIPVFTIVASNMTVTNLGGGKVKLDSSGSQGPTGPAGTLTIGSGITGGATDGFLLMVSNGATLGQVTSSAFQRAISFPVVVNSGGSGLSTAGSGSMLIGMNSSGVVYDYYLLKASNNATVTLVGTSYFVSALTASIAGKQDTISIPLIIGSGGTGRTTVGSAHTLLGVNSDGTTLSYYAILASDNTTVIKSGTGIYISATTNAGGVANTAGLVSSSLTINTTYPLSGGGNLSTDRTFAISTGGIGQVLITSGGVTGNLAWVNTLGGASGVVYAATGNTYIVTDLASDLTNEFRLVQSGNSITISTAGNLIVINAVTNAAGGGGTQTIQIPMALLTVKLNSANAFWTAKSGTQIDATHIQFVDSGLGIATYWAEIPNNIANTANWNIVMKHEPDTGAGGNVAMTFCAQVMSDGSVFDANTTVLLSARSFATYASGTMAVVTVATGVIDNTLGLAANQTLYVIAQRLGNNAGDTVNAAWNLKNLKLQLDVNS